MMSPKRSSRLFTVTDTTRWTCYRNFARGRTPIATRDDTANNRTNGHAYTSGGEHEYSFGGTKNDKRKYGEHIERIVCGSSFIFIRDTRIVRRANAFPVHSDPEKAAVWSRGGERRLRYAQMILAAWTIGQQGATGKNYSSGRTFAPLGTWPR